MWLKIPLLKDVPISSIQDNDSIEVKGLFKALEAGRNKDQKPLRRDNFLKYKKDSIVIINGENYCKLDTVIHFCYEQRLKHAGCKQVTSYIGILLLQKNDASNETALSLYQQLANYNFGKSKQILYHALRKFKVEAEAVPTLIAEHKDNFSDEEWDKIRFFEWHFHLSHPDNDKLEYEQLMQEKIAYFSLLKETEKTANFVANEAKLTISCR